MASESQDAPKQRLWTGVALALVVAIIALTGEFFRLQSEKMTHATALQKLEVQIARYNARAELTDEQKAKRLERAKFLRGKWRVWAVAHKDELKQMINAQPDDQAAFMVVWNAIPAAPEQPSDGINSKDLNAEGDTSHGEAYTWNAITKANVQFNEPPTADDQKRISRSQNYQTATQQEDFKQWRDVEISSSVQTGTSALNLWASGRITERKLIDGRPTLSANGVKIPAEENQEVVPIYDFLKD